MRANRLCTEAVGLVRLRRLGFRHFAESGRPPAYAPDELAALAEAHAVVLDDDGEIAFANPFAAVPSAFFVRARGRVYHAVCAWDALGILAALEADGRVTAACPDCGETIEVDVRDGALAGGDAVVHFLVPAERWYEDLRFT